MSTPLPSGCSEGLSPGRKCTPFLVLTPITSAVRLSLGSRFPGTCRAPASPPPHPFSLWGPIFPYMVKAVPRGGEVRTKVALLQPACHNS